MDKTKVSGISGNQLKIIAAIAMTIDHIGVMIFPDLDILRIIGRLALPIFAYMIAEGCRYTKNKKKYLLLLFAVAVLCQIVYFVTMSSLEQSIMTTFLMSALIIFSYEAARKRKSFLNVFLFVLVFAAVFIVCEVLPEHINGFSVDYGFWGVLAPFFVYLGRNRISKLLLLAVALLFLTLEIQWVQGYSFLALIPLYFYNGTRGKWRMKYFFYIYYPLHLGVIHLISML